MQAGAQPFAVTRSRDNARHDGTDLLAVEEPLELRVGGKALTVTMRTPGHDAELALGFLVSEGIVRRRDDLAAAPSQDPASPNVAHVHLREGLQVDTSRAERSFFTTSACGVCGKSSLEALALVDCPPFQDELPQLPGSVLAALPSRLRAAQAAFEATGGMHATGLFSAAGELLLVREDVGRHNAFDKVVGAALLAGQLPLSSHVALVSGRASFELVQKAAMAGIRILAAVGAPTSLAVQLAAQQGITLAGFVRDGRFNLYSSAGRVLP